MWDDDLDSEEWQPLRSRRAGPIRIIAVLIVAAMVIALVIPVLLRIMRSSDEEPDAPDGVRAIVVEIGPAGTIAL